MELITLTKVSTPIIRYLADALGWVMNGIYNFFQNFGISNIGLCIIIFTLIINIILTPLRIKQQKSTKIQSVITPEMQAITNKYKGKADEKSQRMQQAEMSALYEKYGFSPMGGCLPLLIEMPIIIALYQVIYRIPAYVTSVGNTFKNIVNAALAQGGFVTKIAELATAKGMSPEKFDLTGATDASVNSIIDLFAKFDVNNWKTFYEAFPGIESQVSGEVSKVLETNSFLGISLLDTPKLLGISILIPILAGLFQFLVMKTSGSANQPQAGDQGSSMMKSMNTTMPVFSVVMCMFLPCGVGLYWVASSGIRLVQQWVVNKYMSRYSAEDLAKQNIEKQNAKRAKKGLPPIKDNAAANLKNIEKMYANQPKKKTLKDKTAVKAESVSEKASDAAGKKTSSGGKGIASKAAMVKDIRK